MKRNVSVVKLYRYMSECVCSKIIKELPGLIGSGTPCITQIRLVLKGLISNNRVYGLDVFLFGSQHASVHHSKLNKSTQ